MSDVQGVPTRGSIMVGINHRVDGTYDSDTELVGPFRSREEALAWIKADAEDLFDLSQVTEDQEGAVWGSTCIILEVLDIVRPTPAVQWEMKIESINLKPVEKEVADERGFPG